MKAIDRLQKELAPTAAIHKQRDIDKLRKCIEELQELAGVAPEQDKIRPELHIAVKAIVTPRRDVARTPLKPALNMEDDDAVYYE